MVSISENKAPEGKPILSEVANMDAQTSMPRDKVTGAVKDENKEQEKQAILTKCKEIASKISKSKSSGEISELIARLNALAASAEALGIKINVSEMIAAASAKESAMSGMAGVSSEGKQGDVAKAAREAQEKEWEKEWDNDPRRGEWTKAKIEAAYREFDKVNEPRLKKLRKKNAIVDDALRAIDAGEPPSEEHKEVLRPKTPEEMEQERQHKEELDKMEKIAKQDHDYHDAGHKEVEEKIRELEARKQRHKDAGDHHAAAAVDKEMAPHLHQRKYYLQGKKTAVAKLDTVKKTREEYEEEEKKLQEVKKEAKKVKKLGWGELAAEHGAENIDQKEGRIKEEVLRGIAFLEQESKRQEALSQALNPVALLSSNDLQLPSDFLIQQPKDNKEVPSPDQKIDVSAAAPVVSSAAADAKKHVQGASGLPEIVTRGASIISSAIKHAEIHEQPANALLTPAVGGMAQKPKRIKGIL